MKSVLVRCFGFMGDTLFATSLAKKLREEGYDKIAYAISIPQVQPLLMRDPNIDIVYLSPYVSDDAIHFDIWTPFDREIHIPRCSFIEPPTIQMQKAAGITNPTTEFKVYTNPVLDSSIQLAYENIPYVTIMHPEAWKDKSYRFTKEEYDAGNDVHLLGYGGKHRDIPRMVENLISRLYEINIGSIIVGSPTTIPTLLQPQQQGYASLDLEASTIKESICFIGTEGGLANLSAGVGTRTVLTYDFIHQLYGYNGSVRPVRPEPKLGPRYYFPHAYHVDINPYLSDEEVAECIFQSVLMTDIQPLLDSHKIFMSDAEVHQWL